MFKFNKKKKLMDEMKNLSVLAEAKKKKLDSELKEFEQNIQFQKDKLVLELQEEILKKDKESAEIRYSIQQGLIKENMELVRIEEELKYKKRLLKDSQPPLEHILREKNNEIDRLERLLILSLNNTDRRLRNGRDEGSVAPDRNCPKR